MESRLSSLSKHLQLFDIIPFNLLEINGSNIVRMKLESLVSKLSLVEKDEVSEEENTAIPHVEVVVHDGLVYDDLLLEWAIFDSFLSVVVELQSLLELLLGIHIVLVGFNDWHATLTCLNDLQLEITDEIIVVLQWDVGLDCDGLSVFFLVSGGVEIAGEFEESLFWVAVELFCSFDVIVKRFDFWHVKGVAWCWVAKNWHVSTSLGVVIIEVWIGIFGSQITVAERIILESLEPDVKFNLSLTSQVNIRWCLIALRNSASII